MEKNKNKLKLSGKHSTIQSKEQTYTNKEINNNDISSNVVNLNQRIKDNLQSKQTDDRIKAINNILEYAKSLEW